MEFSSASVWILLYIGLADSAVFIKSSTSTLARLLTLLGVVSLTGADALVPATAANPLLGKRDNNDEFKIPGPIGFSRNLPRDYSKNAVWSIGSWQKMEWQWGPNGNWNEYTIRLFNEDPSGGGVEGPTLYRKTPENVEEGYFMWKVSNTGPFGDERIEPLPVYFFWLVKDNGDFANSFVSTFFNITSDSVETQSSVTSSELTSTAMSFSVVSSSTLSSSALSSGALSSSMGLSSNTPLSSAAPGPTSEPPPMRSSSSRKDMTPIALGVGLGVGIPFLFFVGILIGMKMVSLRQYNFDAPELANMYPAVDDVPELVVPVELPASVPDKPQELAGS